MNKDEILIIKPGYPVKKTNMHIVYRNMLEQMKNGLVLLPFGYEAVTVPKDVEVKIEEKPEEVSTPWDFIDNSNYSPFDSQGKERLIFCTECGCNIKHYDPMYQYCPYCGKRHYFENQLKMLKEAGK